MAAALAAAIGLLAGCSGGGHKTQVLPTTIGGAPGVKGAPDAYPTYSIDPPADLAKLGVSKGQAVRIRSGYSATTVDVAPNGVLVSIPLLGRPTQQNGVTQQALVDPATGKITRITAVHPGASVAGATVASNGVVVWTEMSPGSSCSDPSNGCYSWFVYEAPKLGAAPRLLARQNQPVPLRGVPTQIQVSGTTACWAASADNQTWSLARVPLAPGASQEVTQVNAWVPDCVAAGSQTVLDTTSGYQNADPNHFATPNVVAIDSSGGQSVIATHSENASVLGDQVAYVRVADPQQGRRQVWVTTLTNGKPRKLLDQGDVYRVAWLDQGHLLANTDGGLLQIDVQTGANSVVVPPNQVALLARSGDGKLVFGRGLPNQDTEIDTFPLPSAR